jgi:glycosyltransferase involved in cell wall biosynthesis
MIFSFLYTMTNKSSVLIAATHPLQCTGYARVGATLANGLVSRGHAVTYWGYQNLTPASGRSIHPSINVLDVGALTQDPWGFGEAQFGDTLRQLQDIDVIILYNDVMVINRFLDAIPAENTKKVICYVDMVHDDEDLAMISNIVDRCDQVWVFADHWKTEVLRLDPKIPVHVVPHGIDAGLLTMGDDMSKVDARAMLRIPQDVFVVVNTNRNSYRKALDLTIDGFVRFWKTHRDSVLVLNNNEATDSGYNITQVIVAVCHRLNISDDDLHTILDTVILRIANGGFMPDSMLAALYTASDVGLNTCLGEGFGLCQLEGACLGRPQIATKTGGLCDILKDEPHILIEPTIRMMLPRGFILHSGTLDIPNPEDVCQALTQTYESKQPSYDPTPMRETYCWDSILDDVCTYVLLP